MSIFAKPSSWGPSAWVFLHCVVQCFPEHPSRIEQKQYLLFFNSLSYVLPCKACRHHYQTWLKLYPVEKYLDTKKKIENWLFMMHNYVNLRLNKKLISCKDKALQSIVEKIQSKK